jgi:RNA polymerase sigma-70 factor (ECF subfamily)
MADSPMTDDELVQSCREGKKEAFAALYYRYRTRIFSFCLTLVRNPSDAEDALQDAFRYIFSKIGSYEAKGRFKSFIFKIAHSVSIDILRKRSRQASIPEEYEISAEPEETPRAEQVEQLRGCIARLPSMYREVLALRVLDDLAYEEVAEVLELPLGTVKSRIHHAVALLRKMLRTQKRETWSDDAGFEGEL